MEQVEIKKRKSNKSSLYAKEHRVAFYLSYFLSLGLSYFRLFR